MASNVTHAKTCMPSDVVDPNTDIHDCLMCLTDLAHGSVALWCASLRAQRLSNRKGISSLASFA